MNIIEVKDLEFEYKNYDDNGNETESSKVLKGINLTVPKGQFVAVLGHNGCGKSTLAKHFNGILVGTKGKVLPVMKNQSKPLPQPSSEYTTFPNAAHTIVITIPISDL